MAFPRFLDTLTLVPVLSVLFAIFVVARLYLNYRKFPQFNGPFLASISGLWLFRETLAGRMYVTCADALQKYGGQQLPIFVDFLSKADDQARLSGSSPT